MRLAVLSDVHANLPALQACLDVARRAGVDAHLCAGDLVGWGPQPRECVALLREVGAVCVAGNHDLAAAGVLAAPRGTPAALETMRWTGGRLDDGTADYLRALPGTRTVPTPSDGPVVVAHGSLDDPEEYVRSPQRADALLDRVAPGALLVLGHTHEPWVHARRSGTLLRRRPGLVALPAGEAVLLNPGSVGQSRTSSPDARLAVVDLERRTAELLAVPYDLAAVRRALAAAGLPEGALHVPRPLRARARERAIAVRDVVRQHVR